MTNAILQIKNLTKVYGSLVSVDNLSLDLEKGEFLSFLGPSGSGKTTTLNMVAGLTDPTEGEILLQGKPITALKPYQRNIGMVFQNYALFPHMTVAKNVAFPLEMRRMSKSETEERVKRALDLVNLAAFGDRLPSQLSGGQQQRVALARAMVFEPPLLLMDEPLGALDKKLREQMQLEIRRLHQRIEATIIYVTHDQDEALTMSDRIGVFRDGRVDQVGTPDELYNKPKTRFVADFIGQTNLLDGKVSSVSGGSCRVEASSFDFQVDSAPGVSAGEQVCVSLRPERIKVGDPRAEAPTNCNSVTGVVEETVFFGASRRYLVRIGDTKLAVSQTIQGHDVPNFGISDQIPLHWSPDSAVVLSA